ncbi:MAG TPA: mechanosensitive ion channel family protein [Acidimicrobiales bacterium]|jgi:moderate conductance mechanosensitive channel|nr:mechanosensitive ion channel family protein [Acidimicrobiales bacterium]
MLAHAETPTTACGSSEEAGAVCTALFRLTGSEAAARAGDLFLARPTKILLVLALAWLSARLVRRAVGRFIRGLGAVSADVVSASERSAGALLRTGGPPTARTAQRAETIGGLLASVAGFAIWTVAALTVLGELGVDLGPLVAGAGIVGIALGFGAQNLVRDFLSGIFMLIEDQYGVGDVIDVGPASGTVEGLSLRTTRLRDVEGNVWHVPNGEIARVANKSQDWSRALLDVQVAYATGTYRAAEVIERVARETWEDPHWSESILAEPEVWGVEALGADGVVIRLVVKTQPLAQWRVARELRARIKRAFDDAGIEIPFPQRTVWFRSGGPDAREAATAGGPDRLEGG